jgi:hypothetical protein
VAKVLIYVQSAERRSAPDELWVEVWSETIGHLAYEEAIAAVRAHYAASTRSIMPADIVALAETLSGREVPVDAALEQEADRLGITASEYLERVDSDPSYIVALERRAREKEALDV